MTFLGAPADARVYDLTYDLKIDQVVGLIAAINAEIERDYPELQMDIWASGDTSGRALKVARQRVESKVQERRPGYDATLTAAQRIAMAIGGIRGYPGYEGLAADPREYGTVLDHTISHRPVFAPDPMDDIEEATAFWGMAGTATATGYPLEMLLEDEGYPPARIAKFVELRDEKQAKDMEAVKAKQRLAMGDGGDTEDDADFDLDSDGGGDGSEDD
jgi:outer membrane murein-binding lipoprotein Lpp